MTPLTSLTDFIEEAAVSYQFPSEPAGLYDPLRYFLSMGGKRLRPVLTLMTGELFEVQKEQSLNAALSIELFHNFSLIHDDIMDAAPLRRGRETVHTKWNSNIAILSGDVLLVEAYKLLAKYPDQRLPELITRFNTTAEEVYQGQQLDMDFESLSDISEAEYIEMIRLKTAVLLGCALEFGAILGNQDATTRQLLYNFGVSLGIAFQIQDDLLDLYADPTKFGKQVGGDILSNKKTLLLLAAQKIANDANDSRVDELLLLAPTAAKIETAQVLFKELGADKVVEQRMEEYYQEAMKQLQLLPVSEEKKEPLKSLARYLIQRDR